MAEEHLQFVGYNAVPVAYTVPSEMLIQRNSCGINERTSDSLQHSIESTTSCIVYRLVQH